MDSPQDQDAVVGLDFSPCPGSEFAPTSIDLARLQRASEGAEESAGRRRDHVVDCGRVRVGNVARRSIMAGNGAVDPKPDRLAFSR